MAVLSVLAWVFAAGGSGGTAHNSGIRSRTGDEVR
jgi:hypothetical protein